MIGNPNDGIPPFRAVKPIDLKWSNKGQKVNSKILTNMKKMMVYVERAAKELNVWEDEATGWTTEKVSRMYETIHWKFCIPPRRSTCRYEAITWKTYLNMVKNSDGKLVGDDSGSRTGLQSREGISTQI